ncbi:hypothetical protein [Nocardia veterana]|uniref:Uncharacterized protein n=1 Tax=Nocardia veterana TaxID=132249 RepID=A0A7X6M407_9NOCA|nr:hypothetical protein [Nocardia veterana]NKY89868.1 hypothetical protein [Nocardia veterana]
MHEHEYSATEEEVGWWAAATRPVHSWPPFYDKGGFESFEAVHADLTKSLRALGLTLQLVDFASDEHSYEYRLIDAAAGVHVGRAFIVHARYTIAEILRMPAGEMAPPIPLTDDPPF